MLPPGSLQRMVRRRGRWNHKFSNHPLVLLASVAWAQNWFQPKILDSLVEREAKRGVIGDDKSLSPIYSESKAGGPASI